MQSSVQDLIRCNPVSLDKDDIMTDESSENSFLQQKDLIVEDIKTDKIAIIDQNPFFTVTDIDAIRENESSFEDNLNGKNSLMELNMLLGDPSSR